MFRIFDIEPIAVALPLASPMKMSGDLITVSCNLIVRASDGEGNEGWGEAASAPLMTGETLPGMVAAATYISDRLAGKEVESIEGISEQIGGAIYGNPGAKAAVEMALVDLAAKRMELPLFELLGGKVRSEVAVIQLLSSHGDESEAEQVRKSRDAGMQAFKVKVGSAKVSEDIERCRVVRESAGAESRVSADANEGYCLEDAIDFCRRAGAAGLDFVEQPVSRSNLEYMRECSEASAVPIAADEGFRSIEDIRSHRDSAAAAGGSLKPLKFGIANLVAASRLMSRFGMRVNIAGKVAESSIGSAAIAHISAIVEQLDWDASITSQYLAADIVKSPVQVVSGMLSPPESPGLGVFVDYEKLRKVRT